MFISFWISGRFRKKKGYDEVYERHSQKAHSYAWYATLATILFLFWLTGFTDVSLSTAPLLGILMFVHIGSWGISLIVLMMYTYS